MERFELRTKSTFLGRLIFRSLSLGCAFGCFFSFLAVLTMIFGFYASSRIFLVVLQFYQLQKSKKLWPSENQQHNFSKFLGKSRKNLKISKMSEFSKKSRFSRKISKSLNFRKNHGCRKKSRNHDFRCFFENFRLLEILNFENKMLLIFWRS